jgi:hypothetical protein
MALAVTASARAEALATADPGGQVARFVAADPNVFIVQAPPVPVAPQGMTLQVIDYIDCTKADDGHPMLHDGRSRVTTSDAGTYRETGAAPNSWFAYRFRVAGVARPHVIVLEFPDDADRMTALAVAQPPSGDDEQPSARTEFGYRTGDLLPVSGRMAARWTVLYPTSEAPAALLVANWHARHPAALARVWVCVTAEDRLPPRPSPLAAGVRRAGLVLGDPRNLSSRFGGRADNLLGTMDCLGVDDVVFDAARDRTIHYNSKALGARSSRVDALMTALDGGGGKGAVAAFSLDVSGGRWRLPGIEGDPLRLEDNAVCNAWQSFVMTDFLEPYGRSFVGLLWGAPDRTAVFDRGMGPEYGELIMRLQHTVERTFGNGMLFHMLGRPGPDAHLFSQPGSDGAVVARWQRSGKSPDEVLSAHALATWRSLGVDVKAMGSQRRLVPMWRCGRDDGAAARFGRGAVPRYWMLDDLSRSPGLAAAAEGLYLSGLSLDGTPDRRVIGLAAPHFWWTWSELAPTLVPVGEAYWAPLAAALGEGITPWALWIGNDGSAALHEDDTRLVTNELAQMPLRRMELCPGAPEYPVSVRTYNTGDRFHVQMANRSEVEAVVKIRLDMGGGDTELTEAVHTLPPWSVKAMAMPGTGRVASVSQEAPELEPLLVSRLDRYAADLEAARKAGVPLESAYDEALSQARRLRDERSWQALDRLLCATVVREPRLRQRVATERPHADVPQAQGIVTDGRLDDWPADAAVLRLDGAGRLVCHPDVANQWHGPADLSAEVRLAWSQAGLHYAIVVTDDQPTEDENEAATMIFAPIDACRNYAGREWAARAVTVRRDVVAAEPYRATVRQRTVTIHEGLVPAESLGEALRPAAGRTLGFNVLVCDSDDRAALPRPWQKSAAMAWSNSQDGYDPWSDAQTCGEITFK